MHHNVQKLFHAYRPVCLYILLGCQLSASSLLYAQQKPAATTAVVSAPDDRSPIRVRQPDAERLRDLETSRDYQYGTDAPPPDNPVGRFIAYIFGKLRDLLASEAYQNVGQYVLLAAIAGLVIYWLMKAEVLGFLFAQRAQSAGLDYENLSENIHEINFDEAIDEAARQRNYRLATRLLYLQTLKRLTDTGQISYKADKTNRQYVHELSGSPRQADFDELTRQFEFVWYGNFPIDESRFAAIQARFRQFMNSVAGNSVAGKTAH